MNANWKPIIGGTILCALAAVPSFAAEQRVASPDGRLVAVVSDVGGLRYRVDADGKPLISPSRLGLDFDRNVVFGPTAAIEACEASDYDGFWDNRFGKRRAVKDRWNQIRVCLLEKGVVDRRFAVIVRAYDDGVALRYEVPSESKLDRVVIYYERTEFRFADDCRCWVGDRPSGGESLYPETRLSAIPCCDSNGVCRCAPPLVAQTPTRCVAIAEAGGSWANMALCGTGGSAVRVVLPPRSDGCGCVSAAVPHLSPWRIVMAVPGAAGLLDSDLIANLGHEDASGRPRHTGKGGPTPPQTVTLPFTLGLLGPLDFATDDGPETRARRLARPVICLGSSDVASSADKTTIGPEVPTAWDETVVLDAEIARHVVVARRSGETWWLVALNGNAAQRLRVPLRFLADGAWRLHGYADVPDAGAAGPKHPAESECTCSVTASDTLILDLPPAGGYAAVLSQP